MRKYFRKIIPNSKLLTSIEKHPIYTLIGILGTIFAFVIALIQLTSFVSGNSKEHNPNAPNISVWNSYPKANGYLFSLGKTVEVYIDNPIKDGWYCVWTAEPKDSFQITEPSDEFCRTTIKYSSPAIVKSEPPTLAEMSSVRMTIKDENDETILSTSMDLMLENPLSGIITFEDHSIDPAEKTSVKIEALKDFFECRLSSTDRPEWLTIKSDTKNCIFYVLNNSVKSNSQFPNVNAEQVGFKLALVYDGMEVYSIPLSLTVNTETDREKNVSNSRPTFKRQTSSVNKNALCESFVNMKENCPGSTDLLGKWVFNIPRLGTVHVDVADNSLGKFDGTLSLPSTNCSQNLELESVDAMFTTTRPKFLSVGDNKCLAFRHLTMGVAGSEGMMNLFKEDGTSSIVPMSKF